MVGAQSATWIAFGSVVKRTLTTFRTPTRRQPRIPSFLPPHHTLVSKASKGRKFPKNHFTSHRPLLSEGADGNLQGKNHDESNKKRDKGPKRKAAQRTQGATTSLRRVAVEAQRSRGTLNFIRGSGKTRHVDPDADTKDVTAYCAADTYNVHVARDLLRREGWDPDPCNTALFPQVLHVQVRDPSWGKDKDEAEGLGDVFVFPSGSVVTWNVSEKTAHHLVEKILPASAEGSHLDRLEAEDLEYLEDASRETSEIIGDTIILGTKIESSHHHSTESSDHLPETDTILAKIAFSSALARSTKLAVLENSLTAYFSSTSSIPSLLAQGKFPQISRSLILRKTGELLQIRAQLNLYSELTDSLPDLLWDSPHELGLESYYDALGKNLDVGQRIKALNEKMDYANETASVLRERLSESHSHLLEWIIIWLIMIEVAYGSLHLWRERRERVDPESTTNLMRAYLERELAKGDRKR